MDDFHLDPSGDQFLLEANLLWGDLKAGNVTCGVDTLRKRSLQSAAGGAMSSSTGCTG